MREKQLREDGQRPLLVDAELFDLPPQKWTGLSRFAFGLGGADVTSVFRPAG